MDVSKIPIMQALTKRMSWLHRKQGVLAQNIANADTPDYKPNKLKEQTFDSLLDLAPGGGAIRNKVALRRTDARHFSVTGETMIGGRVVEERQEDLETTPTGNSVVIEHQMMDLTNTQVEYGMIVNLYKKNMALLKSAIGRSGR